MEEMFASYFECRNGFEFQVTSTWHIYRGEIISQLQKQNAIKLPAEVCRRRLHSHSCISTENYAHNSTKQ